MKPFVLSGSWLKVDRHERIKFVRRFRRAFTLVELLIVIAVIVTLAGIMLPILASARGKAGAAACASNLRQLHKAYALYASDHDELVPPYQNGMGGFVYPDGKPVPPPERGMELVAALYPYTRSRDIWFCPSDVFARTDSEVGNIKHRHTSYLASGLLLQAAAYGKRITIDPYWMRGETLMGPSDLGLLTDNLWGCKDIHEFPPAYSHNDWYNFLYFDGHVKARNRDCE